jgi:hypothetical protein
VSEKNAFHVIAKVAGVVAADQLSFNAGHNSGIQVGDSVMLRRAIEVTDPDTGEKLGEVFFPRLRLKVNLSSEKFSVARVEDRVTVRGFADKSPVRRLKSVTLNPDEESSMTVLVYLGENAVFTREESEESGDQSSGAGDTRE